MKQLIQNYKTGDLFVGNVPIPSMSNGYVLVENKFSLISAGTEKSIVSVGKASIIGKAKQRPDLVKQVITNIKKEGLKTTFDKVKTKLDSLATLGYSTSGVVIASLDSNREFNPGDRVACAGQNYASHAEIVSVPQNLVVKIPDGVSFKNASFTTLGAIALQGVRQSEPALGDNIGVIGLGLLGQITCQLLKANGCNVLGLDVSQAMVDLANKIGAAYALNRKDTNLISAIENFTNGHGFDKVIITASTRTNDPIVLSTEILRKKGQIIVVGAVPMEIPRDPHFYKKELELKISTSYGPGRYDINYEEKGLDYPYGYVRWTEKRNMESFLKLLSNSSLDMNPLISHVIDIIDAKKAYNIILGKEKEKFVGILLKYPENDTKKFTLIKNNNNQTQDINIGFIGAGSYAQGYLIPACKAEASLDTVVTKTGNTAKSVADKFNFNASSTSVNDIYKNNSINTVFIVTQHNTHADFVVQSLNAGKNVFVEKPLALNYKELDQIMDTYKNVGDRALMVGFNRRFAPISKAIKKEFTNIGEPLVMNFRVNAGNIPKDHWTQTEYGGGRIAGEMCHFVDLMQYFTDARPTKVFAECISSTNYKIKNDDNLAVIIKFSDGSVGNLLYVANGDKSLPKEELEIFSAGKAGIIKDFRYGVIYKNNKSKKIKLSGKGQKQEVQEFITSLKLGQSTPIAFESMYITTLTTFKIIDSLTTGLPQTLD